MSLPRAAFAGAADADPAAIRLHIPRDQPGTASAAAASDPADWDSLSAHLAQLQSPPRTQLVQGEMLHAYLMLPPQLLERHPWLRLPWGRRRNAASGAAASATAPRAPLPCPHHMHVRLRVVGADESQRHALAVQAAALAAEAEEAAGEGNESGEGEEEEGDEDDDGSDIVHDGGEATDSDADADAEEVGALDRTTMSRSSTGGGGGGGGSGASPSRPRASTTTRKSVSHSSTNRSGGSLDLTRSRRFAFRKSTLPMALPSSSPMGAARRAPHHPGKLAPGYSPAFHGPGLGAHGGAGGAGGHLASVSPLNHLHSDQHSTPGCDERAARPPVVKYFYFDPQAYDADAGADASASAASVSPSSFLVLHVQTVISILPAYLSSPTAPPFGSSEGSGGGNGGGGGADDSDSNGHGQGHASADGASQPSSVIQAHQLLALELALVSPPARHHQALNHATLHLDNTGMFLVENQLPGTPAPVAGPGSGYPIAAGPPSFGYTNLRAFVAQNRALQVPHLIPPARAYVTVVEPLQLSGKSICLSSGGGGGDGGPEDALIGSGGGSTSSSSSHANGCSNADICIELTVQNVTSHWTVHLQRLEFLLNRSRIFLKLVPSSSATGGGAHAVPASSPGGAVAAPGTGTGAGTGAGAGAGSRSDQRSVHYLPLAQFFSATMDSSLLPLRLAPHEQLNLLCFLSAPAHGSGPRSLSALESLVRGLLSAPGGGSGSAGTVTAHPSFSLATSSLPYRTPFTVHYSVDGVGEQGRPSVVQQSKVVWRSAGVGQSGAGGGATITSLSSSNAIVKGGLLASSPRLDRWNALSPPILPSFPSSSGAAARARGGGISKLSLRFKVSSPVPLHRSFPVFLTVTNHGFVATSPLQLVVLPHSHPVVMQAARIIRAEQSQQTFTRTDGGHAVAGGVVFGSAGAVHPFSPTSPAPPLLFSPHAPFSPNTPFGAGSRSSARSHADQFDAGEESPLGKAAMHFPFHAVEHTMATRRRNSVQGTTRATALPRTASGTRAAAPGGPLTDLASLSVPPVPASSLSAESVGVLGRVAVSRQDSTSSGEVLTTTLAHFLADASATTSAQGSAQSNGAAPHSAADSSNDESTGELRESSSSSLLCLETGVSLGVIPAQGERSVTLHYLALREGLLSLSTLFLFDASSELYYRAVHNATVFAIKK